MCKKDEYRLDNLKNFLKFAKWQRLEDLDLQRKILLNQDCKEIESLYRCILVGIKKDKP